MLEFFEQLITIKLSDILYPLFMFKNPLFFNSTELSSAIFGYTAGNALTFFNLFNAEPLLFTPESESPVLPALSD